MYYRASNVISRLKGDLFYLFYFFDIECIFDALGPCTLVFFFPPRPFEYVAGLFLLPPVWAFFGCPLCSNISKQLLKKSRSKCPTFCFRDEWVFDPTIGVVERAPLRRFDYFASLLGLVQRDVEK